MISIEWAIFFLIFSNENFKIYATKSQKKLVEIKIIEEPANFNMPNNFVQRSINDFTDDFVSLKPKMKPAKFTGPKHMEKLNGKCFEKITNNYKWIVCPFQNVTQFEQNIRWNPYKGILGIYYEWEIIDNKFNSLIMLNGDDCGANGNRQTKVIFKCNLQKIGNKTEVESVSEPKTCKYEVVLKTNLVCNISDFENYEMNEEELKETSQILPMNVYPHLNVNLQKDWNQALSEFKNNIITEKTYNMSLVKIFQNAEYFRNQKDLKQLELTDQTDFSTTKSNKLESDKDLKSRLSECQEENKRLKDLLKISNQRTTT